MSSLVHKATSCRHAESRGWGGRGGEGEEGWEREEEGERARHLVYA